MKAYGKTGNWLTGLLLYSCLMALPQTLHALELGEFELHSSLNQPLNGTIQISGSDEELGELRLTLGSKSDFNKMGIPYLPLLNSLQFQLMQKGRSHYIQVTSTKTIREPFLEFVLSVDWLRGKMLRDYSVLLSPQEGNTP